MSILHFSCRPRESGDPCRQRRLFGHVGQVCRRRRVISQRFRVLAWVPAFAGTTILLDRLLFPGQPCAFAGTTNQIGERHQHHALPSAGFFGTSATVPFVAFSSPGKSGVMPSQGERKSKLRNSWVSLTG